MPVPGQQKIIQNMFRDRQAWITTLKNAAKMMNKTPNVSFVNDETNEIFTSEGIEEELSKSVRELGKLEALHAKGKLVVNPPFPCDLSGNNSATKGNNQGNNR